MVILDAMGVIYEAADDVVELLIPFAREHGCDLADSVISQLYTRCNIGEFSSTDLWRSLGIDGKGEELDAEYVRGYRLTRGVRRFLRSMQDRGTPVACLSNDVAEWSARLRRLHSLEEYVSHWIISGDIGSRKPDTRIYEHLIAAVSLEPADCLFVDDRPRNLDAARGLGFQSALFTTDPVLPDRAEHRTVTNFGELETLVSEQNRCATGEDAWPG